MDINKEFKPCAKLVREVKSCKDCLHKEECEKKEEPVSELGSFVVWVNNEVLPAIEMHYRRFYCHDIKMRLARPNARGNRLGAPIAVNMYVTLPKKRLICRAFLFGDETADKIEGKIYIKYLIHKRKFIYGKQDF